MGQTPGQAANCGVRTQEPGWCAAGAGSCRAGLVTVSASPAIGWQIKDVDSGQVVDARVRFEATGGDGRVEVHGWCSGDTAKFSVDDRSGSDDGGGSGGSDSSGRGGGDG